MTMPCGHPDYCSESIGDVEAGRTSPCRWCVDLAAKDAEVERLRTVLSSVHESLRFSVGRDVDQALLDGLCFDLAAALDADRESPVKKADRWVDDLKIAAWVQSIQRDTESSALERAAKACEDRAKQCRRENAYGNPERIGALACDECATAIRTMKEDP